MRRGMPRAENRMGQPVRAEDCQLPPIFVPSEKMIEAGAQPLSIIKNSSFCAILRWHDRKRGYCWASNRSASASCAEAQSQST